MRRWFHAWQDQDASCPSCKKLDDEREAQVSNSCWQRCLSRCIIIVICCQNLTRWDAPNTVRDYAPFFPPILCYMEGNGLALPCMSSTNTTVTVLAHLMAPCYLIAPCHFIALAHLVTPSHTPASLLMLNQPLLPHMPYLHLGNWIKATDGDIDEPFHSDRHFIDAKDWRGASGDCGITCFVLPCRAVCFR